MDPNDPFYSTKYEKPVDTNYGIPIFWHYDKAELSGKEEFKVIYKKIDEALKIVDSRYHILSLSVYGDFSLLGDVKDLFKDWPCKVMAKHIPKRDPYCKEKACDAGNFLCDYFLGSTLFWILYFVFIYFFYLFFFF